MTVVEILFIAEREAKVRTLLAQAFVINSMSEDYEAGISYLGNSQSVDVFVYKKRDSNSEAVMFESFRINRMDEEAERIIDETFTKLLNNQPL